MRSWTRVGYILDVADFMWDVKEVCLSLRMSDAIPPWVDQKCGNISVGVI